MYKGKPVIVAMRPKHWIKNLLVFALPLSDGLIIGSDSDLNAIVHGVIIFISLNAMSSANYILNDIRDIDRDRMHAEKRLRPVASGELSIGLGILLALGLLFLSLVTSLCVGGAFGD